MKKICLVTLPVLFLIGLLVVPMASQAGDSVNLGGTEIKYLGIQQNTPKYGQCRVRYQVKAGPSGLDKWKLEMKGFSQSQIVSASGNWQWNEGPFVGIRFSDGYSPNEVRIIEIVLDGNYADTQQLKVGVWTNSSYYTGPTITGPSSSIPTATSTATSTATATWTPTSIATDTATPTSTFTPTPTATSTATATFTPTPVTTDTATPTATWTPTQVATGTATAAPTSTATSTTTPTSTPVTVFACGLGPHQVAITKVEYNLETSKWFYQVKPGMGLTIEKIIFGISDVGQANVVGSSLPWKWVASGAIVGLKLLDGISAPMEVWFELRGHWDVGPITIGIWSDSQFYSNSGCRGPTAPAGGPS